MSQPIPLYHHIYSSLGGYKTLYISQKLPDKLEETLEEIAGQVYPFLERSPLHFTFFYRNYFWLVKVFFHGSDHVGRARKCVHTVLIDREWALKIPFFSPSHLLGSKIFLTAQTPLANFYGHLPTTYKYKALLPSETISNIRKKGWEQEDIQVLYNILLSQHQSRILLSPTPEFWEKIRLLSGLLPWASRIYSSLIQGDWSRPLAPLGPGLTLASPQFFQKNQKDFENWVVVDLKNRSLSENYPRPNQFCQFVVAKLFEEPGDLIQLVHFLENYPIGSQPTNDMLDRFLFAFLKVRKALSEKGKMDMESHPLLWIQNMVHFSQAGYDNLALDIARQATEILKKKYHLKAADEMEKRVEYLIAHFEEFLPKKETLLTALATLLGDCFRKIQQN